MESHAEQTVSFNPELVVSPLTEKPQASILEEVDEGTCRTEMSDLSQTSETSEEAQHTMESVNESCTNLSDNLMKVVDSGPTVMDRADCDQDIDEDKKGPLPCHEDDTFSSSSEEVITRPRFERKSSMKMSSEPLHINTKPRVWKCLPAPDMNSIKMPASSESNAGPSSRTIKSSVSFGDLTVRSYTQTIGDNPSVSYGPPIQLDWEFEEHEAVEIDLWEQTRAPRRTLRQMILNYHKRRSILTWQYGHTDEELRTAKRQAKKIKAQRSFTQTFLPALHLEAAIESVGRKAKRYMDKRKKKGAERGQS